MQSEWSIWTRDIEAEIVPTCEELGIALVPFSPLGRGFLTGTLDSTSALAENDMRRHHPRFKGDALDANLSTVDDVRQIADAHDATPGQIALAWLLAKGPHVVPIPGTKRIPYIEENLAATEVELSAADLARLDSITATGERTADPTWINRSTPPLATTS